MSQFRQNPISKHWVLIAPKRAERLDEFNKSGPTLPPTMPEVVPSCVFCPGNEALSTELVRLPAQGKGDWQIRIVENKFEALTHRPLPSAHEDFYVSRPGVGEHEVIVTRRHNEPVALQSLQTVELCLDVFRQRLIDFEAQREIQYVQIFHNHGRDAGASAIHPHYQVLATPLVPPGVYDEMLGCFHYYQENGTCIYCAIMEEEKHQAERVVFETDAFIAITPYASRSPFETWILPKRHSARFQDITADEVTQLAYLYKLVLAQLYVKLGDPPLNMYIHTMPYERAGHGEHGYLIHDPRSYHWHMTIFPRLTIWAGFEYATGIPINPVPPEDAAKFLR
jgi:UDPglucose--hexose-1-phosphate uridylyltransferase